MSLGQRLAKQLLKEQSSEFTEDLLTKIVEMTVGIRIINRLTAV